MATKKKSAQKSYMSNPPKSRYTSNGRKRKSSKRGHKRNPSTALARSSRKSYRRNPSPASNAALLAIGGALVITLFDEGVNRFLPTLSDPIRVGAKVAAGYVVGTFGKKYLGGWATIAQGALWLMAALDAVNVWVKPALGLGGTPQVVQQVQVSDQSTGELGTRYFLSNGHSFDIFGSPNQQYAY